MQKRVAVITVDVNGLFEIEDSKGRIYTASRIKDLRNLIGDMGYSKIEELKEKQVKLTKAYGEGTVEYVFEVVDWNDYVNDGFVSPRHLDLIVDVKENHSVNGFDEIRMVGQEKDIYNFYKTHLNPYEGNKTVKEADIKDEFALWKI